MHKIDLYLRLETRLWMYSSFKESFFIYNAPKSLNLTVDECLIVPGCCKDIDDVVQMLDTAVCDSASNL